MLLYDSLMSWSKSYLPLLGGVIGGCIVRVTFPGCTLMLSLGNKSNAPSMVSGITGSDNSSASIKAPRLKGCIRPFLQRVPSGNTTSDIPPLSVFSALCIVWRIDALDERSTII